MPKREKLTKAQLELLRSIHEGGGGHAAPSYPPRRALLARGLLTAQEGRFSDILRITPEGRRVLSEEG